MKEVPLSQFCDQIVCTRDGSRMEVPSACRRNGRPLRVPLSMHCDDSPSDNRADGLRQRFVEALDGKEDPLVSEYLALVFGYSLRQIATALGIDPATVCRWRQEQRKRLRELGFDFFAE